MRSATSFTVARHSGATSRSRSCSRTRGSTCAARGCVLPFPSFALVFSDPVTLAAAEAVVAADPDANTMTGKRLRSLTAYVTQIPTIRGAIGVQLCLLFDANTEDWPWIVTRDAEQAEVHVPPSTRSRCSIPDLVRTVTACTVAALRLPEAAAPRTWDATVIP